ncbi:hypothetical protein MRX96_038942 [Rhipicephalus microplus]
MAQPCKRAGQTPDSSHMPSKRQDQRAGERNCGDTNEPTTDDGASTIVGIDEKVDDWSDMEHDNFKMVLRPRTQPHTTTNVPDDWLFKEPRGTEDARTVSATPAPLNAGSEVGVDTSNASSDGDQDEPSGHESGSPESTLDSWD